MKSSEMIKVGVSVDVTRRHRVLNNAQPFTSEMVGTYTLADHPAARQAESHIHKELAHLNAGLAGFDGATEWFNTTPAHAAEVITQTIRELGLEVQPA